MSWLKEAYSLTDQSACPVSSSGLRHNALCVDLDLQRRVQTCSRTGFSMTKMLQLSKKPSLHFSSAFLWSAKPGMVSPSKLE
ncbi:unnamed protein product [Gadus morhua 'NCC']